MKMTTWPLAGDFEKSLQNPRTCFRSRELKECEIELGHSGQPLGAAGQFAVVYKATLKDGSTRAIRVFTSERPEMTDRYKKIGAYLSNLYVGPLISFDYHVKGIRAINREGQMQGYPLVTMEWVPGEELYTWVRSQCLNGNAKELAVAADRWLALKEELTAAKIAHGDLCDANVMVLKNGDMKLVDYDCMCVPELEGERNLEIGVEPYQHPMRNAKTLLSPNLDNFSVIFIFVVLRAVAADTGLWGRFVEPYKYEKLLIRAEDFKMPTSSCLYNSLVRSPDREVARMTKELFELYRTDIHEVPPLEEILNR